MRHVPPLIAALLAVALMTGCGDDGDEDFDPPRSSKVEIFRANITAQCLNAKALQKGLDTPSFGDEQELAAYLRDVLEIESELRRGLRSFDPPADLRAGLERAVTEEERLGKIVASYERAARGGRRDFETVLSQLESAINPQIRRVNRAFGAIEIPGCQGEEQDFGFTDP